MEPFSNTYDMRNAIMRKPEENEEPESTGDHRCIAVGHEFNYKEKVDEIPEDVKCRKIKRNQDGTTVDDEDQAQCKGWTSILINREVTDDFIADNKLEDITNADTTIHIFTQNDFPYWYKGLDLRFCQMPSDLSNLVREDLYYSQKFSGTE